MTQDDASFRALLAYIHRHRGIDFSNYKPSTLRRRLAKRMQGLGIGSYAGYLDHIQASPEEFVPLLDTLFINVTGFFRDPEAWEVVRKEVVPGILEGNDGAIRVWCAGVATGQEAYSLATLFGDAMEIGDFLERVRIFATDLDDGALVTARAATYDALPMEDVPDAVRERYFDQVGGRWQFRPDLRRTVSFGRHNLLDDAPISRLDLLVCRNTLMYFNREAQGRILSRFHFALEEHGCLFLGKAEMLLTRRNLFTPTDARARIFHKVTDLTLRDRRSGHEPGRQHRGRKETS